MIVEASKNIRILRTIIVLFIGAFATLFTGCGTMQTYDGHKLQKSEVAIIKPYDPLTIFGLMDKGAHSIRINKIDGKDLDLNDKCEVLPGRHKVSINMPVNYGGYIDGGPEKDISFDVEAGHVYTVYGRRVIGGVVVWVVDDTIKKVVAKEE